MNSTFWLEIVGISESEERVLKIKYLFVYVSFFSSLFT